MGFSLGDTNNFVLISPSVEASGCGASLLTSPSALRPPGERWQQTHTLRPRARDKAALLQPGFSAPNRSSISGKRLTAYRAPPNLSQGWGAVS